MKALVIYYSESGNTEKVAQAIAQAVGADLKRLRDITPAQVAEYDLVFFGIPTQGSRPAPAVMRFLAELAPVQGKKAAAFATMHMFGAKQVLHLMEHVVESKGYAYLGGFSCLGWSRLVANFGPRIFNRGRPSADDLVKAASFAREVLAQA